MADLLLEELKKYPNVRIEFGIRCVGIEDLLSNKKVKVMAHQDKLPGQDVLIYADYVLGADGANSSVRRIMCIPYEGYTWKDFRMIGSDIVCDLSKQMGYRALNFIVGPEDWSVIAYTGEDHNGLPLWRVAYPEPPELPDSKDAIMARAQERVPVFLHGLKDFKVTRAEPYMLHQRCASQGRKGRILLGGDALQSNNPVGGLGLTTGILDACAYGKAFVRVRKGGESDSLLTACANSRRDAFLNTTNPTSILNHRRLQSFADEDVKDREAFFQKLNTDPSFAKQMRLKMNDMLSETFATREKDLSEGGSSPLR